MNRKAAVAGYGMGGCQRIEHRFLRCLRSGAEGNVQQILLYDMDGTQGRTLRGNPVRRGKTDHHLAASVSQIGAGSGKSHASAAKDPIERP